MRIILIVYLLFSSFLLQAQPFEPASDEFLQMYSGNIKWADLDNDQDLDIIYQGFIENANEHYTKVYENINGTFTERITQLPNIRNGGFSLGDFDNDGDLDVLLTGLSDNGNVSVLYKNSGNFAFSVQSSFQGLINSTATWFDIDNDKDLDILLVGVDDSGENQEPGADPFIEVALVYENKNNSFFLLAGTNLPPCTGCSMDWADSNGDGYVDLLMTGWGEDDYGHTWLYINNSNKTFSKDTSSILRDVNNGDVKWGDFDNDGDMDVLLTGSTQEGVVGSIVYENDGQSLKERSDIQLEQLSATSFGGTRWIDYNNDGYLDILLTGGNTVPEYLFKLYKNNGIGNFIEIPLDLQGIADGSLDIGDYDNDGDLDICFMGSTALGPTTGIYKNVTKGVPSLTYTKPLPPGINSFSENNSYRNEVVLNWGDGSDVETPINGLTYNFYLRNSSKLITAPNADLLSGYLRTSNPSNGHSKKAILRNIPEGQNFWAVQSIDGAKSGSVFSSEKSFYQIHGPESIKAEIINKQNIKLTWIDNSLVESSYLINLSTSSVTGFSQIATLPQNANSYTHTFSFLTDTYYYYRISASNATKTSVYDTLKVLIPKAPSSLTASSVNASQINLAWEDNSIYESGYVVERKKTIDASYEVIDTLSKGAVSFMDSGLEEGTSYDYRVKAIIEYGSSEYSNQSTAKTNSKPNCSDFTKEFPEDQSLIFTIQDFTDHFSDADPMDELDQITIISLPQNGTLNLNLTPVTAGQVIQKADLSSLKFIPLPNVTGETQFNFSVNDGKDESSQTCMVNLTITPVNDPPTISFIADVEVNQGDVMPGILFSVADIDTPLSDLIITGSSGNTQIIKNDMIIVQGSGANRTLKITQEAGAVGESTITVIVTDGELNASTSFKINIIAVTAIDDEFDRSLQIYPNPVSSSFNVLFKGSSSSTLKINIYDVTGKVVVSKSVQAQQFTVDFSEYINGIYLLQVIEDNRIIESKKILKR